MPLSFLPLLSHQPLSHPYPSTVPLPAPFTQLFRPLAQSGLALLIVNTFSNQLSSSHNRHRGARKITAPGEDKQST
ncbi:hypothetical protein MVLG_05228 [Microbotryum lychnidis-dioicae p1A1 Lamole]|uniref:Uncharacterized protein n=1 Tax=Microbotryum lychnidis-dioicae (strain p1A1 Lamole / MvSl-1064) TaxID=683840 RepID=U5HDL7_USTV1|nr:hypothetical protein MVLG_05228 [Microbotryum lychnidis-dioicae p1A1 Lamole]|eukprot:KDE04349.1 hypothetical protein MVLG_05228 [Microbotryum lychnidis-dioicae p1A1 Lamole]